MEKPANSTELPENDPLYLPDQVGATIQVDQYNGGTSTFSIYGFEMSDTIGDILCVQFADCSDSGQEIMRGGILVPMGATDQQKAWRIGKVLLAGKGCRTVKKGDYVSFPGDRGLKASNLCVEGIEGEVRNAVFLNEERIFGIVKPVDNT